MGSQSANEDRAESLKLLRLKYNVRGHLSDSFRMHGLKLRTISSVTEPLKVLQEEINSAKITTCSDALNQPFHIRKSYFLLVWKRH